jgi:ParB family chromosome partitioning protein
MGEKPENLEEKTEGMSPKEKRIDNETRRYIEGINEIIKKKREEQRNRFKPKQKRIRLNTQKNPTERTMIDNKATIDNKTPRVAMTATQAAMDSMTEESTKDDGYLANNQQMDTTVVHVGESSAREEKFIDVPIAQLVPYSKHPFRIPSGREFDDFCANVKEMGVLEPITARFTTMLAVNCEEVYEIISGHTRVEAAKCAKLLTVPAHVVEMDDDEADVQVVDFNRKRKNMLPSEIGKAAKLRIDALNRQGKRFDSTLGQNEPRYSRDKVADMFGMSGSEIQRRIRLAYLIPEFQDAVDSKKVLLSVGEDISFLRESEQKILFQLLPKNPKDLTRDQSTKLKKARQEADKANRTADLAENEIQAILEEGNEKHSSRKMPKNIKVSYKSIEKHIAKHFESQELTEEAIQDIILKALESYPVNQ